MFIGIALKQRCIRSVAFFSNQHACSIDVSPLLCRRGRMTGMRKISAYRQRDSVSTDPECRAAGPRRKRDLFARMQMLLAVNPKRAIRAQNQSPDKNRRIV